MALVSSMAMSSVPTARLSSSPISQSFINPLPCQLNLSKKSVAVNSKSKTGVQVRASLKETAVTGLTAAALTASMVVPDVAEAATSSLSPSLQNFLLSIGAGGVVLLAIFGAVIGVSNFDPVKRA